MIKREYGHRREDAADQEIGGLLEQAERNSANDGAAIVTETAKCNRHEAVKIQ